MLKRALHSLLLSTLLVTSLLLTSPAPLKAQNLPDLGDASSAILTPEQEYRLGRAWLRGLRSQVALLDDPLVQDYVDHLVYRLASYSDLQEPDLAIVIVNSREINAFAVPGGVIGLNAGLFLHAQSEDEVAAVIAHEIAHVSQRHFTRRYADSKRVNRAMLAGILASLAVAIAGDPEAGMAGMVASQAGAIQAQLAYSRHHEREADRVGMQTLANAGMDPYAMPAFFERLLRNQQFSGKPPEFVLTHPITETRVADSKSRAQSMPRPPLKQSPEFFLIKYRLQALYMRDANEALSTFKKQYHEGSSYIQQALGFGLAIAAIRAKDFSLADNTLARLQEQNPDQIWYTLALAESMEQQKRHQEAVSLSKKVLDISPGHYGASIILARNLVAQNELDEARALLERLQWRHPTLASHRLLAKIWTDKKDKARSHLAHGEIFFATGQEQKGIQQLRYALKYSEDNFALYSQVKARLAEMETLANEKF